MVVIGHQDTEKILLSIIPKKMDKNNNKKKKEEQSSLILSRKEEPKGEGEKFSFIRLHRFK
jgi:hypothetical protein